MSAERSRDRPWPAVFAALGAMFVGIGLARFAYTPLLPAVIHAGWFSADQAAWLGAANLAGYLLGAMAGRRVIGSSTARAARVLMLATAASFFACAWPVSFVWFAGWRALCGVTGGILMVVAAPHVLRVVPAHRRGVAGGVIFTGVGLGIVASGLVVPALIDVGLRETWLALGVTSTLVTLAAWRAWPSDPPSATPAETEATKRGWPTIATMVVAVYGLVAAGLVPHMVFLVDYIARGLGAGVATGSLYWALFGIGAALGPTAFGALGDRIGFSPALRVALALEVAMVGLLLASTEVAALVAASIAIGAFVPGSVPLIMGRLREIFPGDLARQQIAWSRATATFAVVQAAMASFASAVFGWTGGAYRVLFIVSALSFAAALALDIIAGAGRRTRTT